MKNKLLDLNNHLFERTMVALEAATLDGYEWSDDGFKTYTGRKVNE